MLNAVAKIAAHADRAGDHLLWRGNRARTIRIGGRRVSAHRLAYEAVHGPLPDGLVPRTMCGVKGCVMPGHVGAATRAEHNRLSNTRAACARGHALDGANAYRRGSGGAVCRACRRLYQKTWRAKQRRGSAPASPARPIRPSPPVRMDAETREAAREEWRRQYIHYRATGEWPS